MKNEGSIEKEILENDEAVENKNEIIKTIDEINPNTDVEQIILTNNDEKKQLEDSKY